MQPITTEQLNQLVIASEGRPFSWIDEPEWFCGQRKATFAARDGVTPTKHLSSGTMNALAYSCREKCDTYLEAAKDIEYYAKQIESIFRDLNKTKGKRRLAELGRELYLAECGRDRAKKVKAEVVAKYFRGYEGRFGVVA